MACAFPLEHVVETMRPLPVEPLGGRRDAALASIEGVAMIRGAPVPVLDARKLLGVPSGRAGRFVVVRTHDRRVAIAVDAVLEISRIDGDTLSRLPPLLAENGAAVSAFGALDAALLIVLDAARILPEDVARALDSGLGSGPRPGLGIDAR
jgi:purine-binding chemotaxis protein CheW